MKYHVYFVERGLGRQMIAIVWAALDKPEETMNEIQAALTDEIGTYTLGYQLVPGWPTILDPATYEYVQMNDGG